MRNILVSTISFINHNKKGSEIYTTFANRLIDDVLTKTPYDIMVTTNSYEHFREKAEANPDRVTVREEKLENHKTHVGAFNQLLKFYSIKDIDKKYDWVLYLDCDAGFTEAINVVDVNNKIDEWESDGSDMVALRTNATYEGAEDEFERTKDIEGHPKALFNDKFVFYGIRPEWRGAVLPSEHILLIKNNEKLPVMCEEFEKFCTLFETQDEQYPITFDMEAFEIGVSAFLAGYKAQEMWWGNQNDVLKVGFNHNNWERVKI